MTAGSETGSWDLQLYQGQGPYLQLGSTALPGPRAVSTAGIYSSTRARGRIYSWDLQLYQGQGPYLQLGSTTLPGPGAVSTAGIYSSTRARGRIYSWDLQLYQGQGPYLLLGSTLYSSTRTVNIHLSDHKQAENNPNRWKQS